MRKCLVTNDDEAASDAGTAVGECNSRYEDGGDEPLVNGKLKSPAIDHPHQLDHHDTFHARLQRLGRDQGRDPHLRGIGSSISAAPHSRQRHQLAIGPGPTMTPGLQGLASTEAEWQAFKRQWSPEVVG